MPTKCGHYHERVVSSRESLGGLPLLMHAHVQRPCWSASIAIKKKHRHEQPTQTTAHGRSVLEKSMEPQCGPQSKSYRRYFAL